MEWRGEEAWTTRLGLMKTSVLARKVAMHAWRNGLLDLTPKVDIERHFQYHIDVILKDNDEELDCVREGEREVDLVEAVLGFHRENASRGEQVTQDRL